MMPRLSQTDPSQQLPLIIGWRETVALPDWGIHQIKTKMDTGARTSAIHVDNIVELPGNRVRFDVIVRPAIGDRPAELVPVEAEIARISRVRPTTGRRQHRIVVKTRMQLGRVVREIEISMVSRHGMLCRLLLGRSALAGLFVIDPGEPRRITLPARRRKKHEGGAAA
jgi:hypothetical protein